MNESAPLLEFITPEIACITLNRPSLANRLNRNDLSTLNAHFVALTKSPCRALLLRSTGKIFSAGFDLDELIEGKDRDESENHFETSVNLFAALPFPTICIIDGAIVGGATDFALASDICIGSPRASFFMPAAKIGVPLYASALSRYVSRLGLSRAKRLIFMAEKLKAHEMLALGIISESIEDVEQRGIEIAMQLKELPQKPFSAMKMALNAAQRDIPDEFKNNLVDAFDLNIIRAQVKR